MKNLLSFFLLFVSLAAFGQLPEGAQQGGVTDSVSLVDPQYFPIESNLPGDVFFYTRQGGNNRRVRLSDIYADILGQVPASSDNSTSNEIQTLSKSGATVTLSNGGGFFTDEVNDADSDPNNEIQNLSLIGESLTLTGGGGTVNIGVINTDEQTLTLANNQLSISNGNLVSLAPYANDAQTLSFDNNTGTLSITGTNGGNSVVIPAGNGGDNWGAQSATTDATISGDGAGTPLGVAVSQDPDNALEIRADGVYTATVTGGGGSTLQSYQNGNASFTATATGVTYSLSGSTAEVIIPTGTRLDYLTINESVQSGWNNYIVRVIDRNGVANATEANFMPLIWTFLKRDNLNVVPPTEDFPFEYTNDNPPNAKIQVIGFGEIDAAQGGGTFVDYKFNGVDSYGKFTAAAYVPF